MHLASCNETATKVQVAIKADILHPHSVNKCAPEININEMKTKRLREWNVNSARQSALAFNIPTERKKKCNMMNQARGKL